MNKSFKGKFIPFFERLARRLVPNFLLLFVVLFRVYSGRIFTGRFVEYRTHFVIFFIACFCYGVYYHINQIRTVVNEVRFSDSKIHVIGNDFNSRLEDTFDINKTIIEIK